MARSYRRNDSANALSNEIITIRICECYYENIEKRRVKKIPYRAFVAEVLAIPTSFRGRVAFVLKEFGELPGVKTTRDINYFNTRKWVNKQHADGRYCQLIVVLLEVLEVICNYAKYRRYINWSPFEVAPPNRWFPNGTFGPRRRDHLDDEDCRIPLVPLTLPPEPLVLGGPDDEPIVFGVRKPRLSFSQYNAVRTVRDHPGLTKDGLDEKSGHPDTRTILRKLRKRDLEWTAAILFPGRNGRGGYRIAARG